MKRNENRILLIMAVEMNWTIFVSIKESGVFHNIRKSANCCLENVQSVCKALEKKRYADIAVLR